MNNKSAQKITTTKKKQTSLLVSWTWSLIIGFFILSILDIRFALLGLVCMILPITIALLGKGRKHCSHFCPRGSFLGRIISLISVNGKMPRFMTSKIFKNIILIFMFTMFGFNLYKAGFDHLKIASVIFKMMSASFSVSILMGIVFQPRSWCKICPMGNAAGIIKDIQTSNLKKSNGIITN